MASRKLSLGLTSNKKSIPNVGHRVYTTRFKVAKWNIRPTALDEPRLLKRLLPDWTTEDHREAAEVHGQKRIRLDDKHRAMVAAAEKEYGDDGPLISAGLREHWPARVKDEIRELAHRATAHYNAARAHEVATRFRPYSPRPGTGFARKRRGR